VTTKTSRPHSLRRRVNLLLHRWHRRIGIAVSIFLIWMAVSGWILNHTDALDLGRRHLTGDFITTHYGIHSDIPDRAYVAGEHWLVVGDEAAVFDAKKIANIFSQPRGMVAINNNLFVADATKVILLDASGELIDNISAPFSIEKIGLGCGGVVIANADKQMVTKDGFAFATCTESPQWSQEAPLTNVQREQLTPLLRAGVSLERVLLDLHSGRFFGAWGPYFVDALGLGLIVLALSGVWLFWRHRHQQRRRQHSGQH
jgi:hypothetical protein